MLESKITDTSPRLRGGISTSGMEGFNMNTRKSLLEFVSYVRRFGIIVNVISLTKKADGLWFLIAEITTKDNPIPVTFRRIGSVDDINERILLTVEKAR